MTDIDDNLRKEAAKKTHAGYTAIDTAADIDPKRTACSGTTDESDDRSGLRGISRWPTKPRNLRRTPLHVLIGHVILLLLPIPFSVLAIAAYRLDGRELSHNGHVVLRAMQFGPTILPLVFAGVGGRCLKNIALRKAELGTRLEVVEKLIGSQSLVSAITSALALRSFNLLTTCLLVLWALSPLGGQSSLRLLYETNMPISSDQNVSYASSSLKWRMKPDGARFHMLKIYLDASVVASPSIKSGPVDLWGHAKIPRLGTLESSSSAEAAKDGITGPWLPVDFAENAYSSWYGINIQGLLPGHHTEFILEYEYVALNCTRRLVARSLDTWEYMNHPNIRFGPIPHADVRFIPRPDYGMTLNWTSAMMAKWVWDFPGRPGSDGNYIWIEDPFIKFAFNVSDAAKVESSLNQSTSLIDILNEQHSTYFLYGAYKPDMDGSGDGSFNLFQCLPQLIRLGAHVDCQPDGRCKADRLRRLPEETPQNATSELSCKGVRAAGGGLKDCLLLNSGLLAEFVDWWYYAMSRDNSFYNVYPAYVFDQSDTPARQLHSGYLDWSLVSAQQVSDRLTVLINSYWHAGIWTDQIARQDPFDNSTLVSWVYGEEPLRTTLAQARRDAAIYRARTGWIITLLLTTAVLIALSIINLVCSFLTIAPDLFGYVSSLLRGSNGIVMGMEESYGLQGLDTLRESGTTLDGAQRARLLKDMTIKIEDIRPEENVGFIAFTMRAGENAENGDGLGRLRKGRLYA